MKDNDKQKVDDDIAKEIQNYSLENRNAPKNNTFINFQNDRRKQIYSNMDELQQNRFDDFMNSTFDDKKVRDLIQELLGGKGKLSEEVVQVFRITGKIFCGQLTEEARVVQIEENR